MTALRLASRVRTGDRLTLEADTVGHPTAVYDLLARLGSRPVQKRIGPYLPVRVSIESAYKG